MKRSPLKRKTPLRKITPKTADRNQIWKEICLWRINWIVALVGYLICEWCGERGSLDSESFIGVWGHHKNGDRNDTNLGNCYICHTATCHHFIQENHIDCNVYKTKKEWEASNVV